MIDIKVKGQRRLLRKFNRLPSRVQKRVLRQAVKAAGKPVIKAARAKCPTESKLLKKSIGSKVKVYRTSGTIVLIIGPRTNYSGEFEGKKRNPKNYAHLVHDGFTTRDGRFVKGTPFLKAAHKEQKNQAIAIMKTKLRDGVTKAWKER